MVKKELKNIKIYLCSRTISNLSIYEWSVHYFSTKLTSQKKFIN